MKGATILLLGLLAAVPWVGTAEETRYALVVGNNTGNAGDGPLRYAADDAREVAELLVELGDVDPSRLELLVGPDADDVRLALRRVATAVGQQSSTSGHQSSSTMFLFYYSGHAGFDGLHLAGTVLPGADLRELIEDVPANVRVAVVDACHAGALVYLKGGAPVESFLGMGTEGGPVEGTAYLLSCGPDEKAQESDEYRHSIFTHWFLSGLRGAADFSGDGWVTLPEVWDHTRSGTALSSTRTKLPQRPTWELNVRGQQGVRLTHLLAGDRQAVLEFKEGGDYWVFRDGVLIAEVHAQLPGNRLAVTEGKYLVRRILGDEDVRECLVNATPGATAQITPERMAEIPFIRLAAKGRGTSNGFRHGPMALMQYHGETVAGFGGALSGGVGWPLVAGRVWLSPRLLAAASTFTREGVLVDMTEVQAEAAVGLGIDLGPLILRPQAGVGAFFGTQHVSGPATDGQSRNAFGAIGAAGLAIAVAPFDGRAYFEVGAEEATYLYRREPAGDASPEWDIAPAFRITVGLGYVL